ncbi:MAG: RagB/SusD family nutrient uptake outer membrane protein [Tannerella sp.]|jgi:hypothetical protein|nr:RagB/SusD family nutrient uptake outer membrane protein [Tannerella sp.]
MEKAKSIVTFLPIPSRELRLNPALKQTEGYL